MAKQTQLYSTEDDCDESGKINLVTQERSSQQFCREEHPIPSDISGWFAREEEKTSFSPSFRILTNLDTKLRHCNDKREPAPNLDMTPSKVAYQALSINELIRLAGESFILSYSLDQLQQHANPYSASGHGLSLEETRNIEVIQQLLASAEKVGQQQFDSASQLLSQCDRYSSSKGNPVKRLVYYLSAALRKRIDQETDKKTSKPSENMKPADMEETRINPYPIEIKLRQQVPFCQVCQFAGINAIIDNVAHARKIHIIDLQIRDGLQCTIFMQALSVRHKYPVKHLKLTAVGTESKMEIDETGAHLISFAESMNLSFSFNVVMVADMLDLHRDLFKLDADESVAVFSPFFLYTMIPRKERLENLMRVIKSMKPRAMVITELEAKLNSPIFVNRFIEALFYYGAFFDCMEDCMSDDDPIRDIVESIHFAMGIQNIVAAEGDERTVRHVKTNVWRKFFEQFGVVQKKLSKSSLYQATLVTKNFSCGSSCSLFMDGKSLIVGWKGMPVISVTAWKFL